MRYLLFIIGILAFLISNKVFGQTEYYRDAIFHNLTVDDGLAHRTATAISQDQEGYLWIGTNNGLNRYDGRTMSVYRWDIKDPYSLPDNRVIQLLVSQTGTLWIQTGGGELCRYEPAGDRFLTLDLNDRTAGRHLKVQDITEDQQGHIWILSANSELYQFDPELETIHFSDLEEISLSGPVSAPFNSLNIDPQNRLWVGTSNQGVYLYQLTGEKNAIHLALGGTEKLTLLNQDGDDKIWFVDNRKIYRAALDSPKLVIRQYLDLDQLIPQFQGTVQKICTDQNGHLWMAGYGYGLVQVRESEGKLIARHYPGNATSLEGLSNNHVTDLFIDHFNVLWIGSEAGLFSNHLQQKPFYQIHKSSKQQGTLIDDIVHAVYRDQYLWIGTRNGLTVIDTSNNKFYNYRQLSADRPPQDEGAVSSFLKDSRGRFWIGTDFAGLFQVIHPDQPDQLQFRSIGPNLPARSNLPNSDITDLVEDDWGRLWVGTTYHGIYYLISDRKDGRDYFEFQKVEGLPDLMLTNLYKDPLANTIWVGTWEHGLIRINLTAPENYNMAYYQEKTVDTNSLSFNHVNPIIRTDDHTLWVGTIGGGLNKLSFFGQDSVSFDLYTTHDGLPDNTIHTIQKDELGNLWLAGTGLVRFQPETGQVTYFDQRDGLQSNLFIVNADFKDQSGRLYFGGPNGLNFFDSSAIVEDSTYADVSISGLKILNQEVKVGESINGRIILPKPIYELENIVIREKENDITVDIVAIHSAAPSKNRLRYRLVGHQAIWVDVPDMHATVNYSNLQAGDYTLEIMAANGDGIWNPEVTRLHFKILPYWYKTGVAYGCYALLCLFLLWLFRRVIITQTNLRNNLKIARIEREKDQELAEMKTRFFNNITHELRTPLTLIKGPVEELLTNELLASNIRANYYQVIHQNARKLYNLVNRLLDFRKAESGHFQLEAAEGDFVPFAREIYLSFRQLANDQNIQYMFETELEQLPLFFDRDKLEIVLCNLLSNAFKYSRSGDTVKLCIEADEQFAYVQVADTGRGIAPEAVEQIFNRFYQIARTESSHIIGTGIGLSMVKNLIDLHHGKITVESQPDQGSIFLIQLPLGRAHLSDAQINTHFVNSEQIEHYQTIVPASEPITDPDFAPSGQLLIVEDNPEIRNFIQSIFAPQFTIREAEHGLAALAILKQEVPDMIISDIMMDEMDGITFCTKVKEDPALFHIPLILLTARTSNVYQVDGLSSGADAYIFKPFNAQVLKAQVNSLLKSRAALKAYFTNRITLGPKKLEVSSEEILFLEELIAVIEDRMAEDELSAESLAAAMSMSHSTLYRRIKTYTGESINSFVRSIRLKQAAQLLTDSEMNVSEIAYRVGFSDVNYFGKCFKQQFGISPSNYCKQGD